MKFFSIAISLFTLKQEKAPSFKNVIEKMMFYQLRLNGHHAIFLEDDLVFSMAREYDFEKRVYIHEVKYGGVFGTRLFLVATTWETTTDGDGKYSFHSIKALEAEYAKFENILWRNIQTKAEELEEKYNLKKLSVVNHLDAEINKKVINVD